MRFARLQVDGFGALHDVSIPLEDGLTVLAGPNEAGKSTLLSFLTGVLFGIPNRGKPGHHPPVRGGRHGGSAVVIDSRGGHWTIERYAAPSRSLVIQRPDGTLGSESDLQDLLGGASAELFSSVFAVDLDGLASVRNVSSDEVREVLFTSAVLGQRRSAARASADLQVRRAGLARPRQGDARANKVHAELQQVRADLAAARKAADGLDATRAMLESIDSDRQGLRDEEAGLRSRAEELELLHRLWGRLGSGRDALARLGDLPPLNVSEKRLLECEDDVRAAIVGWSGQLQRISHKEDLRAQLGGINGRVRAALSSLSPDMTEPTALAICHDIATRESLRALQARRQALQGRLAEARQAVERATSTLEQAEHGRRPSSSGAERPAPPADQLESRWQALGELRKRLAERQGLAAMVEREAACDGTADLGAEPTSRQALTLLGATALLAVVGALIAAAGRLGPVVIIALAALAGSCIATAMFVLLRGSRWPRRQPALASAGGSRTSRGTGAADAGEGETARRRGQLAELDRRIVELSVSLTLPARPTLTDVEILAANTELERSRRRDIDEAERRVTEARARLDGATATLREIEDELAACEDEFLSWRELAGLPAAVGIDVAGEALEIAAQLQKDVAARVRVTLNLDEAEAEVDRYRRQLGVLAADLDERLPSMLDEQGAWLETLSGRLTEHRERSLQRKTLERTASMAESDVVQALGSGERSDRLRSELEGGKVLDWDSEQSRIRTALSDLRALGEDLVRRHESIRHDLDELLASDRIAELESREASLEKELDDLLRDYMTLGCARFLISSTLERHELERQPEVVRRASEHFRMITSGRYERVIVDPSDVNRPTIRVVSSTGESLDSSDLSRGAAEQLYLSLRLGLAEEFADRAVALPFVLDDVLVNFDQERAKAVVRDLTDTATRHQVLLFTCHPHLVDVVEHSSDDVSVVRLERV